MHQHDWRTWPTSSLVILVINLEIELFLGPRPARAEAIKHAIGSITDHIDERSKPWITQSPG